MPRTATIRPIRQWPTMVRLPTPPGRSRRHVMCRVTMRHKQPRYTSPTFLRPPNRRQPSAWATVIRLMPSWSVMVRLSRLLRGRDANLCRSRRHVMCQIRRRSTPDSSEYPKYTLLSDCYRYIMRRGSGIPPSEALNRADEWSFSLCCVAIFSLGGLGDVRSSLRDEPAVPFCVIE